SSSPVLRLMTALPAMVAPRSFMTPWSRAEPMACQGQNATSRKRPRRPAFSLQTQRIEGVQQAVLHGEQRGRRTRGRADLRVDALDVSAGRLGGDAQRARHLLDRCAAGDPGEDLDLARGETGR